MKYKVQQWFTYGWDDAPWTIDEVPMVFDTIEEAQAEIDAVIKDTEDAVKDGHMIDAYDREDYRVVPVEQNTE